MTSEQEKLLTKIYSMVEKLTNLQDTLNKSFVENTTHTQLVFEELTKKIDTLSLGSKKTVKPPTTSPDGTPKSSDVVSSKPKKGASYKVDHKLFLSLWKNDPAFKDKVLKYDGGDEALLAEMAKIHAALNENSKKVASMTEADRSKLTKAKRDGGEVSSFWTPVIVKSHVLRTYIDSLTNSQELVLDE